MASLLAAARRLRGQDTTFSTDVKVVSLLRHCARQERGKIVRKVWPRTISRWKKTAARKPSAISRRRPTFRSTLGLLVDTSVQPAPRDRPGAHQPASASSIRCCARDKDQAFVIHFDREVELLQDLTSSKKELESALRLLEISQPSHPASRAEEGGGAIRRAGVAGAAGEAEELSYTMPYCWCFSDEIMSKQHGRKAVILLTDGDDHGSKMTLTDAVASAQHADTLVYSILFADHEGFEWLQACPGWAAGAGTVVAGDTRSSLTTMERKFSSRFRERRAAVSLKFPRRRRSTTFTAAFKRSCATSTASAIHPTAQTRAQDFGELV